MGRCSITQVLAVMREIGKEERGWEREREEGKGRVRGKGGKGRERESEMRRGG